MKSVLTSGICAGVVMLIASVLLMMAFSIALPDLASQYSSGAIFRPWSDPLMYYIYINPILVGILLAFTWKYVSDIFKNGSKIKSGAKFGFSVWAIFGITGMLMTISTFNVSGLMVLTWTISGLIQYVLGGIVIARLSK